MSKPILIKNGLLINEGKKTEGDILVRPPYIEKIGKDLSDPVAKVIDAKGQLVIPGVIDDHVHFREPGLTHKGDIHSESAAAVAGGVTSFMDMPNVVPRTLTRELLEEKFRLAAGKSWANYSFYMGVSDNDNLTEVLSADPKKVCGIKAFLGGASGELLLENRAIIEKLFGEASMLIATHCEHEDTIRQNSDKFRAQYREDVPVNYHPEIRSGEACYMSSSNAIELAGKKGTRLHVLHLSTAREISLFRNDIPLKEKKITCEVCVHYLYFDQKDYDEKGMFIKWNPAIKSANDRNELFSAMLDGRIDVVATDHAPHTLDEKKNSYFKAPSGAPFVQHSLVAMMEFYHQGKITPEKIVEKMCHNPSDMFSIDRRGFLREGYFADLAIINPDLPWTVSRDNILYKCGWSPLEGKEFHSRITHTLVSGNLVYADGTFHEFSPGMRLAFNR